MGYYGKAFDKAAYQRYLDKNDDEYWNDYIKTIRGGKVGNIEEALKDEESFAIYVKKAANDRVSIEMSRTLALELYESLGNGFNAAGTLRSLLRDFFVENRDTTSEDLYY